MQDPLAISNLMAELSGKEFNLSHSDVAGMAKDTTMAVVRSAEENDSIVGVGCIVSMNLPQGYRHLIESVVVLPKYRGHGLGRKMIDLLVTEARKFGEGNVNLTCNPDRKSAVKLYEELGFKKADTSAYRLCL